VQVIIQREILIQVLQVTALQSVYVLSRDFTLAERISSSIG